MRNKYLQIVLVFYIIYISKNTSLTTATTGGRNM